MSPRSTPARCPRCSSDRLESYEATSPSGQVLSVTRCINCGHEQVADTGTVTATAEPGVAMAPDPAARVGPEDALAGGPTQGDYRGRLGDTSVHVTVETDAEGNAHRKVQHAARPAGAPE